MFIPGLVWIAENKLKLWNERRIDVRQWFMEFEKTLTRYKLAGITLVIFNFTSFHLCSSCVFFHHHISFPTRNRNTLAYNRSACSQCQCLQFLLSFVKQSHHHCEGHKFKSCSNQEYFSGVFYKLYKFRNIPTSIISSLYTIYFYRKCIFTKRKQVTHDCFGTQKFLKVSRVNTLCSPKKVCKNIGKCTMLQESEF